MIHQWVRCTDSLIHPINNVDEKGHNIPHVPTAADTYSYSMGQGHTLVSQKR